MHQTMSYRKPAPAYIPSPPPSPASDPPPASRHEADTPPLPEDWHGAIAQARTLCDALPLPSSDYAGRVQPNKPPQFPRIASPAHLGSKPHRRTYRPPTPPRPTDHEWRGPPGLDLESLSFEGALKRKSELIELPSHHQIQSTDHEFWIETSPSLRDSSVSWASTEWEVAQLPTNGSAQDEGVVWWDKIKTLGVFIKNRMKGLKDYGALC
ncbi:hypothetical protein C8R46DRAFT_1323575 [Mycena filopes]|nr:hypothetical protein C8R46DRAFT_1323575 [Mycena filopes]